MIELQILPKKAQNELIDFYRFLVERYVVKKEKKDVSTSNEEKIDIFFNKFSFNMKNFEFNRNEIYE
ncbi:MAG TPA: hypothetical protein PLS94_14615 [Prolixibacteraceae bacterium]|nr:hypothetical protein [Prolixibacteraceae bacterium]HPR59438.1 hypothetical protein [Prolixibacteraceae bacterium]